MDNNLNLFSIYDYTGYEYSFTQWRKETIAKVSALNEDALYFLEDQILRHKGFDAKRFSNNPVAGKFVDFINELLKPFIEKPYRVPFYTQLEKIVQKEISQRESV